MRPFEFQAVQSASAAVAAVGTAGPSHVAAGAQFLAGGTNLVDLMALDVMHPKRIVDINALAQDPDFGRIVVSPKGLRMGTLVRMSELADNAAVKRDYPVIAQTMALAASSGLRNMASLGGNMLQRTRCSYFRDTGFTHCNKREPGSGCAALDGVNRAHAVLGASEHCIATYGGDFAQALIALDAVLEIVGPTGARALRFADLHRAPGSTPELETNLKPGELIAAINVPASPDTRRSLYVKVRDRASYAYALASAAVVLDLDPATRIVRRARIALGGVATVPWRAQAAEAALAGKPLTEANAQAAAATAFTTAQTRGGNAYKVPLGQATLVRALLEAAAMEA